MRLGSLTVLLALLTCLPAMADSEFRSLTGIVADKRGNPLPDSVVQIENARTLQVRSYITDRSGAYRFNQLYTDVDFTVRAKYRNVWSRARTLSKFNAREDPKVNLVVPVE